MASSAQRDGRPTRSSLVQDRQSAAAVFPGAVSLKGSRMPTRLGRLLPSVGKNLAQDKRTCTETIAGLKRSAEGNLAAMFVASLDVHSQVDGIVQPFPHAASLKA